MPERTRNIVESLRLLLGNQDARLGLIAAAIAPIGADGLYAHPPMQSVGRGLMREGACW